MAILTVRNTLKHLRNIYILPFYILLLVHPAAHAQSINGIIAGFWHKTLAELATVPMQGSIEKVKEPLPFQKYKVTVVGLGGVKINGFLSLPVQGEAPAKPWPLIVTAPGYSGSAQSIMLGECQRGYAILQVFPRGQGESAQYFKLTGDKLSTNLEKPGGAYYQGAYTDVIRMIDYVSNRQDIDSSRIAMMGTSQGGGISLAVAAIDKRIKAVVAHVPFLCNFRLAATVPKSLVKTLLDRSHNNKESALKTLDYFDPYILAPVLRVPVLLSAGGRDTVCPQGTIQSVYDRLQGRKGLEIYPDLPHTSCQAFYKLSWVWLDQNFKDKTF